MSKCFHRLTAYLATTSHHAAKSPDQARPSPSTRRRKLPGSPPLRDFELHPLPTPARDGPPSPSLPASWNPKRPGPLPESPAQRRDSTGPCGASPQKKKMELQQTRMHHTQLPYVIRQVIFIPCAVWEDRWVVVGGCSR